ncbi:MAG: glycosyltransferase, partial [Candidatus Altiarchaeota archaeon]|nr:glycosyltransferase [Candidatus Altiarchaeota archaeon]
MIYEGEISGIVEKDGDRWLLLDTEGECPEGYSDRCLSLKELGDVEYNRLKEEYAKRAFDLKSKAMEGKFFQAKHIKILDEPFELYAEKEFFKFVSSKDFIKRFAKYYKTREGAPCLNHVTVKDVRKIEKITSKNKEVVEDTIDMLGELRAELSKTKEWRKILKENEINVALIFPYYNEPTIVSNIRDIWDLVEEDIVEEIIIADGWSTNPSAEVIQHRLDAGLTFVKNPGTGKGEALEGAIKYAVQRDIELVICLDSDIIPPLHTIKNIPPLPIDITCNFFARTFIDKFIKILEEHGRETALKTFYKVSYMRVPKSDVKLTPLRFGGTTKFVRYLYNAVGFKTMSECVYPLAGEYAFNPKFLLEELAISKEFHELYGKKCFGH